MKIFLYFEIKFETKLYILYLITSRLSTKQDVTKGNLYPKEQVD